MGVASGSGWNLWVWLAGGGCGWNRWVWLVGVVVRQGRIEGGGLGALAPPPPSKNGRVYSVHALNYNWTIYST